MGFSFALSQLRCASFINDILLELTYYIHLSGTGGFVLFLPSALHIEPNDPEGSLSCFPSTERLTRPMLISMYQFPLPHLVSFFVDLSDTELIFFKHPVVCKGIVQIAMYRCIKKA